MNSIYSTYIPDGFSTVSPYLFVTDAEPYIDFLKSAFYAEELNRTMRGDVVGNVILKIGYSCLMISEGRGGFEGRITSHYLYVNDVDSLYQRALDHGAESLYAPEDMDYGDRQAGVKDPAGNSWWISMRLEEKNY